MSTNMKTVIAGTFFEMIKQKGIDKVTVKDLVEQCHISRQTFYYHFQDIVDVLEWSAQQAVSKALEISLAQEDPEKALRAFIAAAVENHALIRKLLQSQKHDHLERIFVEGLKTYIREQLRRRVPDWEERQEEMEVVLTFYAFGVAGVLLERCSDPDCDPDQLARQLLRLLRRTVVPEPENETDDKRE